MKTIKMMLVAALCIVATVAMKAQNNGDYFVGKWDAVTTGTPGGDGKSTIILTRVDGKLTGAMKTGKGEEMKFSRDDEKEKSITVYFKSSGYDVYIYLEKQDANHMTGSTMDMFDTTATRVTE